MENIEQESEDLPKGIYKELLNNDLLLIRNIGSIREDIDKLGYRYIIFRYMGDKADNLAICINSFGQDLRDNIFNLLSKYALMGCYIIYNQGRDAKKLYISGTHKKSPTFILSKYSNYIDRIDGREIIIDEDISKK